MNLLDKTIDRLKAFEPEEGYYGAFSGGKDSQVLYHVAQLAGVNVDWHFHLTSVDPPQLLRFIRANYPAVEWHTPKRTMFQLILDHKMLPTRLIRFCCSELKEQGGAGRVVLVGVRSEESLKRSTYSMVYFCQRTRKRIVRPLLDWTWDDVWGFLAAQGVTHCELYDPPYNFRRIGCIGCPVAGKKMWREFRFFPQHKRAYLWAITRLMALGKFQELQTPEDVLKWWISGVSKEKWIAQEAQQLFCFDN